MVSTHTHTHTDTQICVHTCTQTNAYLQRVTVLTFMFSSRHAHTRAHTHTHTHTQTHTDGSYATYWICSARDLITACLTSCRIEINVHRFPVQSQNVFHHSRWSPRPPDYLPLLIKLKQHDIYDIGEKREEQTHTHKWHVQSSSQIETSAIWPW